MIMRIRPFDGGYRDGTRPGLRGDPIVSARA
jgi:hypothetical protein